MFNYVPNKENYSFFSDSNYLVESDKDNISSLPANLWYLIDKVEVYVNGSVEIIGGRFNKPSEPNVSKHVGEYVDGSATINFRVIYLVGILILEVKMVTVVFLINY